MRTLLALVFVPWLFPSLALAWDGPASWYDPANGGNAPPGDMNAIMPGGGGILGTGGARDYNITCANCHLNDKGQQGQIDGALAWNPPLPTVNGQRAYQPGQRYTVTFQLLGEHLGKSGCGPYVTGNINNFAAAFEDASGRPAGVLSSDSGQTATACPSRAPSVNGGTTMLYGDCHAVFSMGGDKADVGRTSWTFTWQAPQAGGGPITISWGVVDGDCMMDSLDDDVKVGTTKLVEATASAAPPRRAPALALLALAPLALLARKNLRIRRRRRVDRGCRPTRASR